MRENRKPRRRRKGENKTRRLSFNLTERQFARFLVLYEQSGLTTYAHFIEARVFNESFKVIKVDKGAVDVFNQLRAFHAQFRFVGVNYNQIVKALKANFTERKAYVMLHKLHKETMKLVAIHEQVLKITEEFKERYGR